MIGRVGSGKSTIQRLMMGLYQPTDGAVLLDGIDLRQLDPADVRRNLGYVSQDVRCSTARCARTSRSACPMPTIRRSLAAAETAGLSDFVNRHPRGFDMPVGERGDSLSGGQRQMRGPGARAAAQRADAAARRADQRDGLFHRGADHATHHRVRHSCKTVVLVTHRTSLLSMVTRVIVIDGGKVVADGPRDRIMEALQTGRIAKAA